MRYEEAARVYTNSLVCKNGARYIFLEYEDPEKLSRPVVMLSLPNMSSSATRPAMHTSSLASSCFLDQLSSSFSGSWET